MRATLILAEDESPAGSLYVNADRVRPACRPCMTDKNYQTLPLAHYSNQPSAGVYRRTWNTTPADLIVNTEDGEAEGVCRSHGAMLVGEEVAFALVPEPVR